MLERAIVLGCSAIGAGIAMIVLVVVGFAMAPLLFPKSHGPATEAAVEQMNTVDSVVPNELIPGAPLPEDGAAETAN